MSGLGRVWSDEGDVYVVGSQVDVMCVGHIEWDW
jgi:hypothetical protein